MKKTNNLKKPKLAFPKDFRQNNKSAENTHTNNFRLHDLLQEKHKIEIVTDFTFPNCIKAALFINNFCNMSYNTAFPAPTLITEQMVFTQHNNLKQSYLVFNAL